MATSAENSMYTLQEAAALMELNKDSMLEKGYLNGIKLDTSWSIPQTTVTDWKVASKYIGQIDPSLAKRSWTKQELNKFIEEDLII